MCKDAFPLPRCDDLLNAAGEGMLQVITKLDMMQGYHQVPLSADASQKTAFVMPEGHYQYHTMPYGLTCALAIFQRLMSKVLHGLPLKYVYWCIDDILIITLTFELHLEVATRF